MTRDELTAIIYARLIAPYGDYLTPATAQQMRITAGLLADDELARIEARTEALRERVRRAQEIAALPMQERPPLKARLAQRRAG